jgi:hypothetical protein
MSARDRRVAHTKAARRRLWTLIRARRRPFCLARAPRLAEPAAWLLLVSGTGDSAAHTVIIIGERAGRQLATSSQ